MTAVIVSTKRDRAKMDLAGVDAGAKMFVGLEKAPGSAKQVDGRQNMIGSTLNGSHFAGLSSVLCMSNFRCDPSKQKTSQVLTQGDCFPGSARGGDFRGLDFCSTHLAGQLFIEIEVRWRGTGNEPCSAIESQVLNCPLDENQNAILECDDVRQVYECPHQPGRQS